MAEQSVTNGEVTLSEFSLVNWFPKNEQGGLARLYFQISLDERWIEGKLPPGLDKQQALEYAQHVAAEYLSEISPGIVNTAAGVVTENSELVAPLLALCEKSGVEVDQSRAGHFKDGQNLPKGELKNPPATLQELCDEMVIAVELGLEEYVEKPEKILNDITDDHRFSESSGHGGVFITDLQQRARQRKVK